MCCACVFVYMSPQHLHICTYSLLTPYTNFSLNRVKNYWTGFLWTYCPGHAGVSGNEWADRLASTADITSGLQLGSAEVLRGLRNFLNMNRPEHHSTDRLKERGVEKGSGRHSTLQGRERSVFNQTNIGIVSRATLGRLLRDGWSMYGPFQAPQCHLQLKLNRNETEFSRTKP